MAWLLVKKNIISHDLGILEGVGDLEIDCARNNTYLFDQYQSGCWASMLMEGL